MSYDVWLEIDTDGEAPVQVGQSINYTGNVRPMWDKALEGAEIPGVAALHATAAELHAALDPADGDRIWSRVLASRPSVPLRPRSEPSS